jgi:thioredoxin-related protein
MIKWIMFFLSCLPVFVLAQVTSVLNEKNKDERGIQWVKDLTWDQVKEKAKTENKRIFIDAFASWCGPCKAMDKEIYPNDTIGNYFNSRFVAVKLQIDKTKNDDQYVKNWYRTAETLNREFRITSYPTLIFLSSDAKILNKEEGYKSVDSLLALGKKASTTVTIYEDPYRDYDSLIVTFKEGNYNYRKLPYLIETAIKLNDTANLRSFNQKYSTYLLGLSSNELYTKEKISVIAKYYIKSSESRFFYLFFPNGTRIDSAMNNPGYSKRVIDEIIQQEEVLPVIKLDPHLGQEGLIKPADPDWKRLFNIIKKKYNTEFAYRNMWQAKIVWYRFYKDWNNWAKYFIKRFEKFGIDTLSWEHIPVLNDAAWTIFLKINNERKLKKAIKWTEGILRELPQYNSPYYEAMVGDTYANLLYKVGRTQQAVQYEKKVVSSLDSTPLTGNEKEGIIDAFDKMKHRIPTWKSH